MSDIVLHQFLFSHFNEKARWALDYKGIAHSRNSLLPGLHRKHMQALSGQGQTPVLNWRGKIVSGSSAIIAQLEREHAQPALYPNDATQQAQALEWQRRLDTELGPATRSVFFATLLEELPYMARLFGNEAGTIKRRLYAALLPAAKSKVARTRIGTGHTTRS